MRVLIWVQRIAEEIAQIFGVNYNRETRIRPKLDLRVYEDNQGTIAMALRPNMTPRTQHLQTKYDFFKEHMKVTNGYGISIKLIEKKKHIADFLTKGVGQVLYKALRGKLMGSTKDRQQEKLRRHWGCWNLTATNDTRTTGLIIKSARMDCRQR